MGNTVGQPTPFNLGEWQTFPVSKMSSSESSKYFSFHLHGSPAPHPAARLCLFLRRSGRNARTAVRRGRGWGRGLPSHPPGYSGAHSCRSDQHHPVPEQGLRIQVRGGGGGGLSLAGISLCISSYGTSYDSLSLGQSSSGYVNKNYGSDNNQAKTGSSNNTAGG